MYPNRGKKRHALGASFLWKGFNLPLDPSFQMLLQLGKSKRICWSLLELPTIEHSGLNSFKEILRLIKLVNLTLNLEVIPQNEIFMALFLIRNFIVKCGKGEGWGKCHKNIVQGLVLETWSCRSIFCCLFHASMVLYKRFGFKLLTVNCACPLVFISELTLCVEFTYVKFVFYISFLSPRNLWNFIFSFIWLVCIWWKLVIGWLSCFTISQKDGR